MNLQPGRLKTYKKPSGAASEARLFLLVSGVTDTMALQHLLRLCALLASVQLATVGAASTLPRLPRNAKCPTHGYPFSDKDFAEFVHNHPLTAPGVAERMATLDPTWFSKAITDFTFATADYAANYFKLIAPLNSTRPHPLPLDCASAKYRGILSGQSRDKPATIIWSSRFNFETPLLLFRLHTYKDLVDFHFISETERVDFSATPKPLMYERVKGFFQEFFGSIVHHVVDETTYGKPFQWTHTTSGATSDTWGHEKHHFASMLAPFLNTFEGYPDDSIVLHGDIDENPDEEFLHHLKHCTLEPSVQLPIRSNAIMWLYDHRHIRDAGSGADLPSPFSFKYPLFWTLGHLRQQDPKTFSWRRVHPKSPWPLSPGGWHFSYVLFPASFYIKMLSMAESGARRFVKSGRARNVHHELATRREQAWAWGSTAVPHPKCLVQAYPEYEEFVDQVPWLVAQNVQQFAFFIPCEPAFYDKEEVLEADYHNCSRLFKPRGGHS